MARITIGDGLWRKGHRLYAEVRIGSSRDGSQGRKRQSFPLGTELETLRAWQHGEKKKLLLAAPIAIERGTLAADVPRFLETLPIGTPLDQRYREDSEDLLAHWAASPLGARPRGSITRLDVITQIARWMEAGTTGPGAAAATVNRRLSRLRILYRTLDRDPGRGESHRWIKYKKQPRRQPRNIPTRIVQLILDSLADVGRAARGAERPDYSETKLRLRVMAWTGIPGATLRRVQRGHLELDKARIYVTPRRKGAGADGKWIALLPPAVDALRDFVAAGLLGRPWSRSSMRRTWHVGIARATAAAARIAAETGDTSWADGLATLPPHCKPYDLRHSFASEVYRLTGDIRAVSELLQHADLETTKQYTEGAVSERVAAAIAIASKAYADIPKIPAPKPKRPALRLVRSAT